MRGCSLSLTVMYHRPNGNIPWHVSYSISIHSVFGTQAWYIFRVYQRRKVKVGDPMTFIYEFDPDILNMCPHINMKFLGQGFNS